LNNEQKYFRTYFSLIRAVRDDFYAVVGVTINVCVSHMVALTVLAVRNTKFYPHISFFKRVYPAYDLLQDNNE